MYRALHLESNPMYVITENYFVNFFLLSKNMNYLKNVLDSIYKSLAPANIPIKIDLPQVYFQTPTNKQELKPQQNRTEERRRGGEIDLLGSHSHEY